MFTFIAIIGWRYVSGCVTLLFWCAYLAAHGTWILDDVASAGTASKGRDVVCPDGHVNQTEGGVYQCEGCSFVYQGSIWRCGSKECGAVTPHIDCTTCGLSIRNPHRWGRP